MASDEKAYKRTRSADKKKQDAESSSQVEGDAAVEKSKRKVTIKQRFEARRTSRAKASAQRDRGRDSLPTQGSQRSRGKRRRKKQGVRDNA